MQVERQRRMMMSIRFASVLLTLLLSTASFTGMSAPLAGEPTANVDKDGPIDFQWGVKIPLHDGIKLNATLYRPQGQKNPLPCIFTLTPYISQTYHDRGVYFAAHGYVFLTVDVRGRGNSEGEFTPLLQEAKDGRDVVEWLATQPYCNGKIAMWGGSYAGYDQWATAKEFPSHLATIVPVASPRPGVEFPSMGNIHYSYDMQWITLTSGHTAQDAIFGDDAFWNAQFGKMFTGHRAFKELDAILGNPSANFQTWLAHPAVDAYWDGYNPTPQQFARIDLPILTITGQYDDDQPGALSFYREHFQYSSAAAKAKHYLVIGPWDHAGTRTPTAEYGGLTFGQASLLDINKLHKDWYDWTLKGGSKPDFLKGKVTYYVLGDGAEQWRYADSLAAITAESRPMYLASSNGSANDVFASGTLTTNEPGIASKPDHYVYDPLGTEFSIWNPVESSGNNMVDVSGLLASSGKILVYHTPAFAQDTELAGFFKFSAWIALDQPDTDIAVFIYAIKPDGSSTLLANSMLRARYRQSLRDAKLVRPGAIERYDFDRFSFIARRMAKGSRLRLVISPMNSRYWEKNYNSGGIVAEESGKDAHTVTVTLYHDAAHPSALYLPIAAPDKSATKSPTLSPYL
jgi:putative CocE/NonD family hydrolase